MALPKLAAPPITPDKAKTLGALVSVAGPALPPHLDSIIPRLLDAIEEETYLKACETEEEIAWTKRESFDDVSKFPAFNALRSIIAAAPEDCGDKLLSEISDALTELAKMSSLKKVDEAKAAEGGHSQPFDGRGLTAPEPKPSPCTGRGQFGMR